MPARRLTPSAPASAPVLARWSSSSPASCSPARSSRSSARRCWASPLPRRGVGRGPPAPLGAARAVAADRPAGRRARGGDRAGPGAAAGRRRTGHPGARHPARDRRPGRLRAPLRPPVARLRPPWCSRRPASASRCAARGSWSRGPGGGCSASCCSPGSSVRSSRAFSPSSRRRSRRDSPSARTRRTARPSSSSSRSPPASPRGPRTVHRRRPRAALRRPADARRGPRRRPAGRRGEPRHRPRAVTPCSCSPRGSVGDLPGGDQARELARRELSRQPYQQARPSLPRRVLTWVSSTSPTCSTAPGPRFPAVGWGCCSCWSCWQRSRPWSSPGSDRPCVGSAGTGCSRPVPRSRRPSTGRGPTVRPPRGSTPSPCASDYAPWSASSSSAESSTRDRDARPRGGP